MATKPNIPQEEVDLGTLFSQIGKMFSNFFNFIVRIFKSIYHLFILILLFIRKNIIPIGIATIIGFIWGFAKDYTSPPVYQSSMIVKTNYGSAELLYEKISEVNTLLSEGNSLDVSRILQIPVNEVAELLSVHIEPRDIKKDSKLAYDQYMIEKDTIYTKDFEFDDFNSRISPTDLYYHTITLFTKTPKTINTREGIKAIVQTDYFIALKNEKKKNISTQKEAYIKGIQQFDSIRSRYNKVALLQAKNPSSNANLNISAQKTTERNVDYDLYNISIRWLKEYEMFITRHNENTEIISFITDTSKGSKYDGIFTKKSILYSVYGFILTLFILGVIKFNKYLTNYEKKIAK